MDQKLASRFPMEQATVTIGFNPRSRQGANFADGLPIVGQRFHEDLILDACEALEARTGMMAQRLWAQG